MIQYFSITPLIWLSIISFTIAQSAQNKTKSQYINNFILEKTELLLKSTDNESIFHCTSRIEIDKLPNKLIASKNRSTAAPPDFQLESTQVNATTIRIHVKPNGYVGVNRIICHVKDNHTDGAVTDLIVGEEPGLIELKGACEAYDRLYVKCKFRAPTIARAFRNGFPRIYQFSENTSKNYYNNKPELLGITDDNELIFKFVPIDRSDIPRKTHMSLEITISYFNSSSYEFYIKPMHTTQVDFQIENIAKNSLTIVINHNSSGIVKERLCAGVIKQIDNQNKKLISVQDISETSNRMILINHLRSSQSYNICLYCFYEQSDYSFRKEICRTATTKEMNRILYWSIRLASLSGFIICFVIVFILIKRMLYKERISITNHPVIPDYQREERPVFSNKKQFSDSTQPEVSDSDTESGLSSDHGYHDMDDMIEIIQDSNQLSPEAVVLSNQKRV